MKATLTSLAELEARLPAGHRARSFEDEDREAIVRIGNEDAHDLQRGSAEEWRHWDRLMPDPSRIGVVVAGPSDTVVASAQLSSGGVSPHPDGAVNGGVRVQKASRGRGIGSTLASFLEAEARGRRAPRWLSSVSESHPDALDWSKRRGFREIGRRIESYILVSDFDPAPFAGDVERVRSTGLRLSTVRELLDEHGDDAREALYRELYDADAECHADVPFPSPHAHIPYETFRRIAGDERFAADLSVVALDGERIVSFTTTGRYRERDAITVMTGTRRAYRGRGAALAVKVEALSRARASAYRALLTTNDEPNKPMRGINARLGYRTLPAEIALEKPLG